MLNFRRFFSWRLSLLSSIHLQWSTYIEGFAVLRFNRSVLEDNACEPYDGPTGSFDLARSSVAVFVESVWVRPELGSRYNVPIPIGA